MDSGAVFRQTATALAEQTQKRFQAHFNQPAEIYFAPGRINLIGEHLDYNGGLVMPAAIGQGVALGIAINTSGRLQGYASEMQSPFSIQASELKNTLDLSPALLKKWLASYPDWARYPLGVIRQFYALANSGLVEKSGFELYYESSLPIGAGLSSSAAVCCATAIAFNTILGTGLSRIELAKMAQLAEIEFAGLECGLMDQYASLHGREGAFVKLDCFKERHELLPFGLEAELILCHSGISHSLAQSQYNSRRVSCDQGLAKLRESGFDLTCLAHASLAQVNSCAELMSSQELNCCRYVVEEMERVGTASALLESPKDFRDGRPTEYNTKGVRDSIARDLGGLLYETHRGLAEQFEVSLPELDKLVELTFDKEYIYGARLMGGGFGGCTLNLIAPGSSESFRREIADQYEQLTGNKALLLSVTPSDGARKIATKC